MTPGTECSRVNCTRSTLRRGLCPEHHDALAYSLQLRGLNWNDYAEQDNYNHETFVQGVEQYDIPLDYLPCEGDGL